MMTGLERQELRRTASHEAGLWQIMSCARDDADKVRAMTEEFGFTAAERSQAKEQATALVQQLRKEIQATADALLERRTLTFGEVKNLLTQSV